MLVELQMGMSVNPDNLKYIKVVTKRKEGRVVHVVQLALDDNSIHAMAEFSSRSDALAAVEESVRRLRNSE